MSEASFAASPIALLPSPIWRTHLRTTQRSMRRLRIYVYGKHGLIHPDFLLLTPFSGFVRTPSFSKKSTQVFVHEAPGFFCVRHFLDLSVRQVSVRNPRKSLYMRPCGGRLFAAFSMMYFVAYNLIRVIVSTLLLKRIAAIRVNGRSVAVPVRHDATLFCQLTDTLEDFTRITWQRRTRGKPENRDFFVITPDGRTEHVNGLQDTIEFTGKIQERLGSITLKNVSLLDEGVYTCIFSLFPSGPFETEIKLTVLVPPVVNVSSGTVLAGDGNVTMATCTAAKARPEAEVSWLLGALSTSLKVETNHSQHPDGTYTVTSHLIGVASKELNQQKVQCLVNQKDLNITQVVDYTIVIYYAPRDATISVAEAAKGFLCEVDGNPKPTIFTWTRENKTLPNQGDNNKLLIPLTSDHNGLYFCEASNQYGSVKGSIYVHVVDKSSILTLFLVLTAFIIFIIIVLVIYYRTRLGNLLSEQWQRFRRPGDHDPVPNHSPPVSAEVANL